MENKFIIFNGILCSKYLTRMKGYAEQYLKDELKKRKNYIHKKIHTLF